MRPRRRGLLIAAILWLTLTGCGASTAPASSAAPQDCRSLRFPYPPADATLTAADDGATVHVPVGGLVEVDLLGSPARHWTPISLTGSAVVSLGTQAETPTVGTRLGEYCAVRAGTAQLSATDGSVRWSAGIVVR